MIVIIVAQRNVATLARKDSDLVHSLSQLSRQKYCLTDYLHQILVLPAISEENSGLQAYISSAVL